MNQLQKLCFYLLKNPYSPSGKYFRVNCVVEKQSNLCFENLYSLERKYQEKNCEKDKYRETINVVFLSLSVIAVFILIGRTDKEYPSKS